MIWNFNWNIWHASIVSTCRSWTSSYWRLWPCQKTNKKEGVNAPFFKKRKKTLKKYFLIYEKEKQIFLM